MGLFCEVQNQYKWYVKGTFKCGLFLLEAIEIWYKFYDSYFTIFLSLKPEPDYSGFAHKLIRRLKTFLIQGKTPLKYS